MDHNERQREMAAMFKALGDPTRLRIFEFLRADSSSPLSDNEDGKDASSTGRTVGEICFHLTEDSRVSPTISFHMKELRNARLVYMQRRGQTMVCRVEPDAVTRLATYFCPEDSGGAP